MKKAWKFSILALLLLGITGGNGLMAQEEEESGPLPIDFVFTYFKRSNGQFELKVNISAEGEDGYYPVEGLPVGFSQMSGDEAAELGQVETDANGNAILRVSPPDATLKDTAGYMGFAASFDGNDEYDYGSDEVYVKDVNLKMDLEVVDSVKIVFVRASYLKGDGMEYPITDQDIYLYSQGMLSRLQIAEGWLVDGACEIEFPEGLPGDKDGNVMLYVAMTEHPEFGNVEAAGTAAWGVVPKYIAEEDGQLWTTIAPTWMIVLLIILLTGVWGHYIFAMIQMMRLKKEGHS